MKKNRFVCGNKKMSWKRAWIPLIGWILAGGFINNLIVHPFVDITLVNWEGMVAALAVMITISATRDFFMKKASNKHLKNTTNKGWKRNWISLIGYTLAAAFAINCLVAPYVGISPNSWPELVAVLGTLLGVSGLRDVFITPKLTELIQSMQAAAGEDDDDDFLTAGTDPKSSH